MGAIDSLCRFGVFKFRVKLSSSLPREIHDIPDGRQFVYSALFDILSQPRMAGIGMTDRALIVLRKNGYRRILIPVFVFATEIVLKRARTGTQESQPVPAARASMASQVCWISCSNDRQIEVLSEVIRNAIEAVDPRRAHRAWFRLSFSEHELIEHDRSIRRSEKLAESYGSYGRVSCVESRGDLLEDVIQDGRALWKLAT